jgi:sugar lactone lactonase YvrE
MRTGSGSLSWIAGCFRGGLFLLMGLVAQAQNLFVADKGSGNIYEFTSGGVRSTFASALNSPFGLAFDSTGDLFVSSLNGNSITEFMRSGGQRAFASGLNAPCGLAFNSAGDLFVAQGGYSSGSIVEITPNGTKSVFASGLVNPETLAFDSAGNLFVQSPGFGSFQGYVTKVTPNGTASTFASGLNFPSGLAVDNAGNLFVSGSGSYIYRFSTSGAESSFYSGSVDLSGDSVFDSQGNLLVSSGIGGGANDVIYRFTPGGGMSVFASGLYVPAEMAFQPVPEPSALVVSAIAFVMLLGVTMRQRIDLAKKPQQPARPPVNLKSRI